MGAMAAADAPIPARRSEGGPGAQHPRGDRDGAGNRQGPWAAETRAGGLSADPRRRSQIAAESNKSIHLVTSSAKG